MTNKDCETCIYRGSIDSETRCINCEDYADYEADPLDALKDAVSVYDELSDKVKAIRTTVEEWRNEAHNLADNSAKDDPQAADIAFGKEVALCWVLDLIDGEVSGNEP